MDSDLNAKRLIDEPNHVRLPLLAELYASDDDPTPLMPSLLCCLNDLDESLQHMAILVMERCGSEAVSPLSELLGPEYPIQIRAAAAASLGRMGPVTASACTALGPCLLEGDETLRSHALFALGSIGEPAIPELQGLLHANDMEASLAALEALGAMGPVAQPAANDIRSLAAGEDHLLQVACAGCLSQIDHTDPQGLPQLLAALQHNEATVRAAAVKWIGKLGGNGSMAVPELIVRLQDEDAMVRAETALALVRVKPNAVEAVEPLTVLLADSAPDVIVNAGIALGTFGEPAMRAIEPLKRLQDHFDDRVAQVAGAAIAHISPKV